MAKDKIAYVCSNCGQESAKWIGKCPNCGQWNTFKEIRVAPDLAGHAAAASAASVVRQAETRPRPMPLGGISAKDDPRIDMRDAELNRVLGGGLVPGSLVLLGGEPGIGKSTLTLQTVLRMADRRILYVSGEESAAQLKMRADRITASAGLQAGGGAGCMILCDTSLESIFANIRDVNPELVVIDSIQTMYTEEAGTAPGSITQVRESASRLMISAKSCGIATFLVGHVTKEGTVAGPRVLEHMVDTVLYFEGSGANGYRIIRSAKNRFGSTNEIGVFEMGQGGLSEVLNPSELMLEGRPEDASGAVVACLMEGTRPIIIKEQALVTETGFGMPRRQSSGIDYNRLNLLLAVLEKRVGYAMNRFDAYVNITGGMRVNEPATDLAVIMAVISSFKNKVIPADTIIFGEVGLSGEVRAVAHADIRVNEAKKLGFKRVILPKANMSKLGKIENIELIPVRSISEAASFL